MTKEARATDCVLQKEKTAAERHRIEARANECAWQKVKAAKQRPFGFGLNVCLPFI